MSRSTTVLASVDVRLACVACASSLLVLVSKNGTVYTSTQLQSVPNKNRCQIRHHQCISLHLEEQLLTHVPTLRHPASRLSSLIQNLQRGHTRVWQDSVSGAYLPCLRRHASAPFDSSTDRTRVRTLPFVIGANE